MGTDGRGKLGSTRKYRRLGTNEADYNSHKKYRTARVKEREEKAKVKKEKKEKSSHQVKNEAALSQDTLLPAVSDKEIPVWGKLKKTKTDHTTTMEDEQDQMFQEYLTHLVMGKSPRSFSFRGRHLLGLWQAAEALTKHFPDRFKKVEIEIAKAMGFARWEEIAEKSAIGENTRANTATLQMIMRNRYDWDRQGSINTDQLEQEINKLTTFFVSIGLGPTRKVGDIEHINHGASQASLERLEVIETHNES